MDNFTARSSGRRDVIRLRAGAPVKNTGKTRYNMLDMTGERLVQISPGLSYLHNPRHRDGSPSKSQWTINYAEELTCFKESHAHSWLLIDTGWGLHFSNQKADHLGISCDKLRSLFIAKFIANDNPSYWHGYPADYQVNVRDIPSLEILNNWMANQIFSRAKIRKILKGQPCRF